MGEGLEGACLFLTCTSTSRMIKREDSNADNPCSRLDIRGVEPTTMSAVRLARSCLKGFRVFWRQETDSRPYKQGQREAP